VRVFYDRYRFRVVAVDGGEPRRSGSVDVVVRLTDMNDNSPTFDSASLEVRVLSPTCPVLCCPAFLERADPVYRGISDPLCQGRQIRCASLEVRVREDSRVGTVVCIFVISS